MTEVKHVLSFGGGLNSGALMVLLLKEHEPLDEVVFADTGGEVPETYAFIRTAKAFLKEHNVPFKVLRRPNGRDLYTTSWNRKVFPSAIWRWSTRDFKITPIYRYYRTLDAHINQYLAITYDEWERMKDSGVPYVTNLYPMIDRKLKRADCEALIREAGLPVPPKSGCFFCPFNNLERWHWLYEKHPRLFQKAVALEENSKHFPSQRLTDQAFRNRATLTLGELSERFKAGETLPEEIRRSACGGACMT